MTAESTYRPVGRRVCTYDQNFRVNSPWVYSAKQELHPSAAMKPPGAVREQECLMLKICFMAFVAFAMLAPAVHALEVGPSTIPIGRQVGPSTIPIGHQVGPSTIPIGSR